MAGDAATHGTSAQSLFLLFLVPLVLLLVAGKRWSGRRSNLRLPPSPPGKLPVIGHLHLVGPHPHVSLRDLARKHGQDLMLLRLGAVNTVVVSSPRAAKAVLRTHDHALASRPRSAVANIIFYRCLDVAFAPSGEPWKQAKKVVATHMLTVRKVHSFRHYRQEEVCIAVAKIREAAAAAATVDMTEHFSSVMNDVVCRAVLGSHYRNDGRNKLIRELNNIIVSVLGGFNVEDYFPSLAKFDVFTGAVLCRSAKRVRKRWDELLDKIIDEHVHREQEDDASADFIHVLLSLQEEYGLTTDNVKAILMDVFTGGVETTYTTLEYAMAELMNNPHVMAKLQAEVRRGRRAPAPVGGKDDGELQQDMVTEEELGDMAYLRATMKETLRLHPPAPLLIPHFSVADCEIDGYTIPAGTRLMINVWALATDPVSWKVPEEFLPERFLPGGSAATVDGKGNDFEYLPFGSGRRICPGINFSNSVMEILLANLLYHFDWELPLEMKEVDMKEVFGLSNRRKEKLLLVPTPRSLHDDI